MKPVPYNPASTPGPSPTVNVRRAVEEEKRAIPAHYRVLCHDPRFGPATRCGWCCRNDYDCTCQGDK